ncbi:MAG: magnesium/cobalt transporter CorA [Flavobacteriaceae bacterium]
MARFLKKRLEKKGTAPGSLVFVGTKKVEKTQLEFLAYNTADIIENSKVQRNDLTKIQKPGFNGWLNVIGVHDARLVEQIGNQFALHLLLQEDVLNTGQRPKFEEFSDHLFMVIKMLHFDKETELIESEQISLIIEKNLLISFQEIPRDVFNPIRERLLRPNTKIRQRTSDYLAFAMLDAISDRYMEIIETFGERIERIEEELLEQPRRELLEKINLYKKEINFLRKTIRPVRDLVSRFRRSDSELINDSTIPYLNDLEDHITHATEAIEIYKEMLNDQINMYNSALNNKLNDIIRVLTIFSVIFIPLTFLAGIYGTNFEYLPELHFPYAYPIFWGVLIIVALAMVYFFKKRRWM